MSADLETVRRWARHNVRLGWVNRYGDHTTVTALAVEGDDLRVRTGVGGEFTVPLAEATSVFTESRVVGPVGSDCLYCGATPGEHHRPVLRDGRTAVCPDRGHEIVAS